MQITASILTYNESHRIGPAIAVAKLWADEVLVLDKGSTDGTIQIVRDAGVRLITIPFTQQGHEDTKGNLEFAAHDWVAVLTPGEIPTANLAHAMRQAVIDLGNDVDIITLPIKLYSFGIHDPRSPWSVGQQPRLVHRRRAQVDNKVHRNFSLKPSGKVHHIAYSNTCHMLHPTHATGASFLQTHLSYALAELQGHDKPEALLAEAIQNCASQQFGNHDKTLFGQECAWKIYWLSCMLLAWEKMQVRNVPAEYRDMTQALIAREWPLTATPIKDTKDTTPQGARRHLGHEQRLP